MGAQQSFYRAFIDDEVNKKTIGTKYTIKMQTEEQDSSPWYVEKNLKEVHEFRLKLCRKFPNIPGNLPLIKILGKFSKSEKDNNRAQVLGFLQEIVRRTDVMTSQEGIEFFELEERLQEKTPEEIVIFEGKKEPITNFIYSTESGYLIYVETDLDEASQVTKQAANQKWPCCKGKENILTKAVSSIKIASISQQSSYARDFLPQGEKISPSFIAQYSKPITSFSWDWEQRRLAVGLSNGKIVIYVIQENEFSEEQMTQSNWEKVISRFEYSKKNEFFCGEKPIVGLDFDTSSNYIIAMSKKQGLYAADISGEKDQQNVQIDNKKVDEEDLTCMEYDKESRNIYVTSNSGIVSVFNFNQGQISHITTFSASIEEGVKAMYLDKASKFLVTASKDKLVQVFEDVRESKSPFKVMEYEGKAKGTQIEFNKKNKDIYVADSTGNITVWGFDSRVPKFAWTAHKKAIIKMQFYQGYNVLVTSSKDGSLKVFVLKEDWIPEPWEKYMVSKQREQ